MEQQILWQNIGGKNVLVPNIFYTVLIEATIANKTVFL